MAKPIKKPPPKAPEKKPPSKGVALVGDKKNLPANLDAMMAKDSGKGISAEARDNLVPIIAITQDKTPEADKNHQRYIDGVVGGMFWLKNSGDPFVPGEDGILVQHCHSYESLVEWKPRVNGGGFIAQHKFSEDVKSIVKDAKQIVDPQDPNKTKWVRPSGNEIIDTRYEVVRVFRDDGTKAQYVMPFTSTGHTVAKGWNTLRGTFHLQDGSQAPSFSRLYRLTTRSKSNQKGTWFLVQVEDQGWITDVEEYQAGLALYNAFNTGKKSVDTSTLGENADDQGGDGKM